MHTPRLPQAFARKWKGLFGVAALSVALLPAGCDSMSHTGQDAGIGAGVGAVFGTALGLVTHHPVEGAVLGTAAGAGIGAAVGNSEDHAEHRAAVQQAQAQAVADQQRRALTVQQIADLTAKGTSDAIIINQIRASGAVYQLDAPLLNYLHDCHVSEAVIGEMQATALRPPSTVVVQPGPVYVDPYGPPVVRVYGGGGWGYGYRRGW